MKLICCKCERELDCKEFYRDRSSKSGRCRNCKTCMQANYRENIESFKKVQRDCYDRKLALLGKKRTKLGQTSYPEYEVWIRIQLRCYDKDYHSYKYYGGRGIEVSERWRSDFFAFIQDMGRRPTGMTIERRDTNGNYCKENCYWAPMSVQARNKNSNLKLTFNGQTKCLAEWCEITKLSWDAVWMRLKKLKWSVDKALTTPLRKDKRRGAKSS